VLHKAEGRYNVKLATVGLLKVDVEKVTFDDILGIDVGFPKKPTIRFCAMRRVFDAIRRIAKQLVYLQQTMTGSTTDLEKLPACISWQVRQQDSLPKNVARKPTFAEELVRVLSKDQPLQTP
jgi:hypothetical protein